MRTRNILLIVGGIVVLAVGAAAPEFTGSVDVPSSSPLPTGGNAAAAFAPLDQGGLVPSDVVDALPVPEGAKVTGRVNIDGGEGVFDRQVNFSSSSSGTVITGFYSSNLAHQGWKVISVGPGHSGGEQVLATRPSSDGYYWEVGVQVGPPYTGTGPSAFQVQLQQLEDED